MLQTFLSTLRTNASNDAVTMETRRRHSRREQDRCIALAYGHSFPVENWSQGGLLLGGDDRLFGAGQDIELTLKFKLRSMIMDIDLRGKVVRKGAGRVAIQFSPASRAIRRCFQRVIDDCIAAEFANSQIPARPT